MHVVSSVLSGTWKSLAIACAVLIGLGLVGDDNSLKRNSAAGFECRGLTDNPNWNRTLCRLHPAHLLNTPVVDLLPWTARQ